MNIEQDFRALTGFTPLAWQARLYREHFADGSLPSAVDVPTGLGKTSVMALWLIARARGVKLPRRLVYIVDRRAVVDQATDEAVRLRKALEGEAAHLKALLKLDRKLPISTLRGQFQDNREWREDPAAPAIIVGTVDMIGSRLLFEGYGVSRKMRPYQAGLLGADALVVLDEAHLVPPFQHLLRAIEQEAPKWAEDGASKVVPPFRLLPLSATQCETAGDSSPPFRLETGDWEKDEKARDRLTASKRLRFEKLAEKDANEQLAREAWRLASENGAKRVIVFCNKRSKHKNEKDEFGDGPTAQGVVEELEKRAKPAPGAKEPKADIEMLVGARRQRERDRVAAWLRDKGFVGERAALTRPAFLVATSAGEVGVDIDADHMVADLAPWERMVQRLGRVNRRGEGDADVMVFLSKPVVKKEDAPTPAEERALLAFAAKTALERLPKGRDGGDSFDASPGALRALAGDPAAKGDIERATTPEPLRPALNRALVEAWSMTSLEQHTGRPEVAPWLRGWVDEQSQTVLVWRAHLPVRESVSNWPRTKAEQREIEDFFEAAPPHESEKLETETYHVVEWLQARATALLKGAPVAADAAQDDDVVEACAGAPDDADDATAKPSATPLGRNDIAAIVLTSAGDFARAYKLRDLSGEKKEKDELERSLRGKTLILHARFGGLAKDGLLDEKWIDPPATADANEDWSLATEVRIRRLHEQPGREADWRHEGDFVVRREPDGQPSEWLSVDHYHDAVRAEDARALAKTAQTLEQHESWAEQRAEVIAEALSLQDDAKQALLLAARLHDEGKRATRWQRAFKAARDARTFNLTGPLAKTCGPIDHAILDGYRHEFGSLPYVEKHSRFGALGEEWRDLVLHLVAAHHGQARPAIETKGCEDAPPSALEGRAREVALRFARLQKRWGPWGLAWWEALLRAADQQASRALEDAAANKEAR
ncbi:MAG: type I-U CRISPR-associated helicase/endonuclease Cas3 [Terricaulis sp.]